MRKNVEEFFLSMKEPNFLAMKLLLELFKKFEYDSCSKRIVDNLNILSPYEIRLIYSKGPDNYMFVSPEIERVEFGITSSCSERIMCHEVGHLVLDLYARGEVPEEFEEFNLMCQKKLMKRSKLVRELLGAYRDDTYDNLIEDRDSIMDFYNNNPSEKELYFIEYPEKTEEDLKEELILEHNELVSATNVNIDNYNRVANIIDAIFHGDNPFWLEYGNEDIDPILAMHNDEYFEKGDFGPSVLGFEEQFADYLVLRTFPEEMAEANQVLRDLLGDEWFTMMDNYYDKVTSRISEKGKVYQHK